jgi:hypothetical protein
MRTFVFISLIVGALLARAAQISAPTIYNGMCDASGAVALDRELFAIADDEDNKLRIYHSITGGPPVKVFDMSGFLHVDPKEPETDIEAAARVGDRIYWITSHGRNRNAKYRESRLRFFATDIVRANGAFDLKPVGKFYADLLLDLFNDPRLKKFHLPEAAALAPKSPEGFNIEALSPTPDGKLLIGFRNPLPQGRALVVPMLNPAEVIDGKPVDLGDPILLDLGSRGLRAMTLYEGKFLLVAGAIDSTRDAKLFFWNGGNAKPQPIGIDVTMFNPEAVAIYPGEKRIQLFSDDGTVLVGGVPCKKLPSNSRSFRAVWITL